jgi:hypothetical protein
LKGFLVDERTEKDWTRASNISAGVASDESVCRQNAENRQSTPQKKARNAKSAIDVHAVDGCQGGWSERHEYQLEKAASLFYRM